MNVFHNERFIFDNTFDFADRTGKTSYYSGEGDLITVRPGNHMWETNFVPDLAAIELKSWGDRGAGGTNIMFVLADGSHARAHLGDAGRHLQEGSSPRAGLPRHVRHRPRLLAVLVSRARRSSAASTGSTAWCSRRPTSSSTSTSTCRTEPARYLATGVGGLRYPITTQQRRSLLGLKPGEKGAVSTPIKEGGDQIEYEDQDPRIHPIWLAEMKKAGVPAQDGDVVPGREGGRVGRATNWAQKLKPASDTVSGMVQCTWT